MNLLGGGAGESAHPLALARGGAGGALFFMIKQKHIRDKMRHSNLSNNMMIKLYTKLRHSKPENYIDELTLIKSILSLSEMSR